MREAIHEKIWRYLIKRHHELVVRGLRLLLTDEEKEELSTLEAILDRAEEVETEEEKT